MKFQKFHRYYCRLWGFIARNRIPIMLMKTLFMIAFFYVQLMYTQYLSTTEIKAYQNAVTIWTTDYHIR